MDFRKRRILETAQIYFTKYGFRRVSIQEICEKAQVSKGTFYKHFKNKDDLIKELLDKLINEETTRYLEIMRGNITFREKVEKLIEMKMEQTRELSKDFLDDYLQNCSPEVASFQAARAETSMKIVLDDLLAAQKHGDIRKNMKLEFMLYFLNHMQEMIKDPQLVALYETPGAMIEELMNFFFYGILTEREEQKITGGDK